MIMFTDEHDAYKASIEDQMLSRAQDQLCCCKCARTAQWQDASNGVALANGRKWCYEHALQWRDFGGVVPCVGWEEAVKL